MDSKRLTASELIICEQVAENARDLDPIVTSHWMARLLADRAALEQRVGELEAALRPFAEAWDNFNAELKSVPFNDEWLWQWLFRIGHIRAAAKALADGDNK